MKICLANRPFQNRGVELSFTDRGVKIQLLEAIPKKHPSFKELAAGRAPDRTTANYALFRDPSAVREFSVAEWRNTREFDAHACYQIIQVVSPEMEARGRFQQRPFNLYAFSQPFRVTGYEFTAFFSDQHPTASVLVPFKDSPVEDWTIGVNVIDDEIFFPPAGVEVEKVTGLDVMRIEKLPKLKFLAGSEKVAEGEYVDLDIQLCDFYGADIQHEGVELFVEATGGILANTRLSTDSAGRAKARLFAQFVIPGDTIKVKAGFKYFAGIDDCLVEIQ